MSRRTMIVRCGWGAAVGVCVLAILAIAGGENHPPLSPATLPPPAAEAPRLPYLSVEPASARSGVLCRPGRFSYPGHPTVHCSGRSATARDNRWPDRPNRDSSRVRSRRRGTGSAGRAGDARAADTCGRSNRPRAHGARGPRHADRHRGLGGCRRADRARGADPDPRSDAERAHADLTGGLHTPDRHAPATGHRAHAHPHRCRRRRRLRPFRTCRHPRQLLLRDPQPQRPLARGTGPFIRASPQFSRSLTPPAAPPSPAVLPTPSGMQPPAHEPVLQFGRATPLEQAVRRAGCGRDTVERLLAARPAIRVGRSRLFYLRWRAVPVRRGRLPRDNRHEAEPPRKRSLGGRCVVPPCSSRHGRNSVQELRILRSVRLRQRVRDRPHRESAC